MLLRSNSCWIDQSASTKGNNVNEGLTQLNQVKGTLINLSIHYGPKILAAILIMTAGAFVANWAARSLMRGLRRLELEPPVLLLFTRVMRLVVLALFAIMALENLGVELLPLIAGLGVAGAGVALATQGVLSNAVAGLTIIFTKPYRVGQYVAVAGVEGQVDAITLFSTALIHADRSRVIVPNRKVVGEILHNYGRIRQCNLSVGVAYDSDLRATLQVIGELVRGNPRVLADPAPLIQVDALADSAVQIAVRPWVDVTDFATVGAELSLSIVEELRRRGISIPFPQCDVHLLNAA
jgi:small conductance mechanosensitive channel